MRYGHDRDLALELTRGVVALAGAFRGSTESQEDHELELFLGLFHPEIEHHARRQLVNGVREERRRRRASRIAQDIRIRNAIAAAARRRAK